VDSTLVRGEVIEMLAAQAGCEAEVARVTEQAMAGELDFEASLRARVALLEGLPVSRSTPVRAQVRLTPGGRTLVRTLKRLGWAVGIVSGGFSCVTDDLVADLGLDHALSNTLEVVDGRLTGRLLGRSSTGPQGGGAARVRRRPGRDHGADGRHRRRGQRPRHARRGRPRHRLQRQAGGARGGRRGAVRAVPGRRAVPAGRPARGGGGGRRS
jgi:phosphoserine phosphatase